MFLENGEAGILTQVCLIPKYTLFTSTSAAHPWQDWKRVCGGGDIRAEPKGKHRNSTSCFSAQSKQRGTSGSVEITEQEGEVPALV